jgi:hypothetical protein
MERKRKSEEPIKDEEPIQNVVEEVIGEALKEEPKVKEEYVDPDPILSWKNLVVDLFI